jgi:hypothetical protein
VPEGISSNNLLFQFIGQFGMELVDSFWSDEELPFTVDKEQQVDRK